LSQIIPASYSNVVKRILIPGLPKDLVPRSPTDISVATIPTLTVSVSNGDEITRGVADLELPPASQPVAMRPTPIKPTDTTGF
jgi:hypothetical protein